MSGISPVGGVPPAAVPTTAPAAKAPSANAAAATPSGGQPAASLSVSATPGDSFSASISSRGISSTDIMGAFLIAMLLSKDAEGGESDSPFAALLALAALSALGQGAAQFSFVSNSSTGVSESYAATSPAAVNPTGFEAMG